MKQHRPAALRRIRLSPLNMTSLRIVSGTGQNYAYNVTTGATTVATPVQTGFSAVAYANNDLNRRR